MSPRSDELNNGLGQAVRCRAAADGRHSTASHFEELVRAVDGGAVFERRMGGDPQRPSLALLHGVPVTSTVFEPLAGALRVRVPNPLILPDLPGLGRSTVEGDVSWSTQRFVLGAWLREQGSVVLVVHDVSGPIALPLLEDDSIDVRGVVLLNTILEPSTFRPIAAMQLLRARGLGALLAGVTPRWLYARGFRTIGLSHPERVEAGMIDQLHAETFRRDGGRSLHRAMRGFELDRATDRAIERGLAARDVPRLSIWGAADPSLGEQRRNLAKLAPGSPVEILPDARHFLMLDHAEEIAEMLVAVGVERW
jgi:pimeloyl-ACP methyl ester carboxylesterase